MAVISTEKPKKITRKQQRDTYIERVHIFLSQIKNWLPKELEAFLIFPFSKHFLSDVQALTALSW
jgi:hypothetical protein